MKAARLRLEVDERREKLIQLGVELFGKHPYDELSVDLIAKKAGVSKGLLYHYFPTKKDFCVETIRRVSSAFLAETEFDDEVPPLERLRKTLEAYLRFAEENREAFYALYHGGVGMDPEARKILDRNRRVSAERLAQGMGWENPSPLMWNLLHSAVGFIESSTLYWLRHKEVKAPELVDAMSMAVGAMLLSAKG